MFRYKNEQAFSKAVCNHLQKKGWFIQRIESGTTGRGIPDIFALDPIGRPYWFELKRVHDIIEGRSKVTIPWRPGQLGWLHNVQQKSKGNVKCFTLACFDDAIALISHDKLIKSCEISRYEELYHTLKEL